MIEIKGLGKHYGRLVAVDDLSFCVAEGEVLGFLGPNGAGKSTTMKMITGFLDASSGSISICGFDIDAQALEAKKIIGYLPEGSPCYGDMTVKQFLHFISDIRQIPLAQKKQSIDSVIHKIELAGVLNQVIDTLSKGFKRRVGLAQAILHDPKVLILDEPTDGLDPNQKYQVRQLIQNLAKDKIVIVSTHILEEVNAICTRAIIINHGKLIIDDTPENLVSRSPTGKLDDVFRSLTGVAV
jgi:ABC-2 type transport system ATP-binding protein